MRLKQIPTPGFICRQVDVAKKLDPRFEANFDKKQLSVGFMEDWYAGGPVACALWAFGFPGNEPTLKLAEKVKEGGKVLATEVLDDYLSIDTLFGVCPFYTALTHPECLHWEALDGAVKSFIIDTLNYIATGKRSLPRRVMDGIIAQEAKDYLTQPKGFKPTALPVKPEYDTLSGISFHNFMALWLSRRDGWQDVIDSKDMLIKFRR